MITLTVTEPPPVPLEAETLSPDVVAGLSTRAIGALPVQLGRRRCRVDDFFAVDGEGGDELAIDGDAGRIKWIGRAMSRGRLVIRGNAGMHLGAYMTGGTIEVAGNADDWTGAEMSGGLIRIAGDAGSRLGATYPGSAVGMTGGTLVVGGAAGSELGTGMKRGTIAVTGGAGEFPGLRMKGGTIIAGSGGRRAGAWMQRGTVIVLSPVAPLPTFAYASTDVPTFLLVYARYLARLGFALPCDPAAGRYRRYVGDASVAGKGEMLVWQPHG